MGDYSEDKTVLIMPNSGNADKPVAEAKDTNSEQDDDKNVVTDADSAAEVMSPPVRTWECPLCKAHIPTTETKCFCCGYDSKLGTDAEKECQYCHKKIKADATYCNHCGAYV